MFIQDSLFTFQKTSIANAAQNQNLIKDTPAIIPVNETEHKNGENKGGMEADLAVEVKEESIDSTIKVLDSSVSTSLSVEDKQNANDVVSLTHEMVLFFALISFN